jgi:hypothetical protein
MELRSMVRTWSQVVVITTNLSFGEKRHSSMLKSFANQHRGCPQQSWRTQGEALEMKNEKVGEKN